jgi:hypothetical protein
MIAEIRAGSNSHDPDDPTKQEVTIMAANKRHTLPEPLDNHRRPVSAVDGADPTNQLRHSLNQVDAVQTSITDQSDGSTKAQRRRDLTLRPGIGDDSHGQTAPGRAV